VATRTEAAVKPVPIGRTIIRIDEEMKYGTIVPEIIASARALGSDIGCDPFNLLGYGAKLATRSIKRGFGYIEHTNVSQSSFD
jgi:hypothetical protein